MGLFGLFKKRENNRPKKRALTLNPKNVKPDNTPLYIKRGWGQNANSYHGYYRTLYGAWRGEIIRRGDKFNVFIFDPPINQVRNHTRWSCFHQEQNDKWRIDLARNPKDGDIGSVIFYVEELIIESYLKS